MSVLLAVYMDDASKHEREVNTQEATLEYLCRALINGNAMVPKHHRYAYKAKAVEIGKMPTLLL